MKTIIDYMDDLKEKFGSDYKSAKMLEVEKQTISSIRKRGLMSDETAIKVADLLDIDRGEVLIAAAMARSEGEVKESWANVGKRAGLAASVMLATIIRASYSSPAEAGISRISTVDNIHYAKS
jgi:hypothetical protein